VPRPRITLACWQGSRRRAKTRNTIEIAPINAGSPAVLLFSQFCGIVPTPARDSRSVICKIPTFSGVHDTHVVVRGLPFLQTKEAAVPSPLFDFLFLVAFFVPIAMYVIGVLMLMASLVATHWTEHHGITHHIEATAH